MSTETTKTSEYLFTLSAEDEDVDNKYEDSGTDDDDLDNDDDNTSIVTSGLPAKSGNDENVELPADSGNNDDGYNNEYEDVGSETAESGNNNEYVDTEYEGADSDNVPFALSAESENEDLYSIISLTPRKPDTRSTKLKWKLIVNEGDNESDEVTYIANFEFIQRDDHDSVNLKGESGDTLASINIYKSTTNCNGLDLKFHAYNKNATLFTVLAILYTTSDKSDGKYKLQRRELTDKTVQIMNGLANGTHFAVLSEYPVPLLEFKGIYAAEIPSPNIPTSDASPPVSSTTINIEINVSTRRTTVNNIIYLFTLLGGYKDILNTNVQSLSLDVHLTDLIPLVYQRKNDIKIISKITKLIEHVNSIVVDCLGYGPKDAIQGGGHISKITAGLIGSVCNQVFTHDSNLNIIQKLYKVIGICENFSKVYKHNIVLPILNDTTIPLLEKYYSYEYAEKGLEFSRIDVEDYVFNSYEYQNTCIIGHIASQLGLETIEYIYFSKITDSTVDTKSLMSYLDRDRDTVSRLGAIYLVLKYRRFMDYLYMLNNQNLDYPTYYGSLLPFNYIYSYIGYDIVKSIQNADKHVYDDDMYIAIRNFIIVAYGGDPSNITGDWREFNPALDKKYKVIKPLYNVIMSDGTPVYRNINIIYANVVDDIIDQYVDYVINDKPMDLNTISVESIGLNVNGNMEVLYAKSINVLGINLYTYILLNMGRLFSYIYIADTDRRAKLHAIETMLSLNKVPQIGTTDIIRNSIRYMHSVQHFIYNSNYITQDMDAFNCVNSSSLLCYPKHMHGNKEAIEERFKFKYITNPAQINLHKPAYGDFNGHGSQRRRRNSNMSNRSSSSIYSRVHGRSHSRRNDTQRDKQLGKSKIDIYINKLYSNISGNIKNKYTKSVVQMFLLHEITRSITHRTSNTAAIINELNDKIKRSNIELAFKEYYENLKNNVVVLKNKANAYVYPDSTSSDGESGDENNKDTHI